jgi:hypothetical protein
LSAKGKIWYSFLNPHLSQIIVEYAQICWGFITFKYVLSSHYLLLYLYQSCSHLT